MIIKQLTNEILEELWVVIGGTPHLFGFGGKEALKHGLLTGEWDDSGLIIDYYTMVAIINKLKDHEITPTIVIA